MPDIGYYTLPVILSMEGIDKQVNSKLGKAFEGIGKKATKDLGTGAKAAAGDIDKLTSSYGKLRDKAEDALGKVRKEESALVDLRKRGITDGPRFVAVEERLATARRNSTRALSDAKRAHTDLKAGQDALAGGTDKLSGKFGALEGVAGKAGKVLSVGLVAAAGAATVGIAALAAGLAVAANELYELGGRFDEISDNFVIKLGATGEKLRQLNQQVTDLGPHLALPLTDIAEITTEVNRHLDGTIGELENVTQTIGDLNRMTGTTTNVKKFGQLLIQWKIPTRDATKTLDMLNTVSQRTGMSVNDLMEIVTSKGASGLRELNMPLENSLALLVQFQDAGLDTATAVDAIGKAAKFAATEGKPLAQVLTDTYTALQRGDPGAAEQAYKVFGKAAGPIIEAIQNGTLTLKDFQAALDGTGPSIAEIAGQTDDFAQKMQTLRNRLEIALKPIASTIFDSINTKLSQLGDWAIHHQDEVLHFIGDIGVGLLEAAKNAIDFGKGALEAIRGIINAVNALPDWLGGEGDIDTTFIDKSLGTLDGIKDKLSGAQTWWRSYTDRAAEAVKLTQNVGDEVRTFVNEQGEIELSVRPSPENEKVLADQGIHIREVDGKITVYADTETGQATLDAFRQQALGEPVNIPAEVHIPTDEEKKIQDQLDRHRHHITADVEIEHPAPPAPRPGTVPPPRPTPGRMRGGAIRRFATGGAVGAFAAGGAAAATGGDLATLNRINSQLQRAAAAAKQLTDNVKATVNAGGQITITTNTPEVHEQLAALGLSIEELPDGTIAIKADTTEGEATLKAFRDKAEKPVTMSAEFAEPELPKPASGLPAGGPTGGGGSANPKGLDPKAASLMGELHKAYPNMDIWGWGPNPDHNSGKCLDAMTLDNPTGLALGDRLVARLLKDPRLDYIIWKQMYWHPDGSTEPYGDHGDRNKNHFTHPHIRVLERGGGLDGYGGGDRIPALLEAGEHVFDKDDVRAMGGQENVYAFRAGLHMQTGGAVDPFDPNLTWDQVLRSDLSKPERNDVWQKHSDWMYKTGQWQRQPSKLPFGWDSIVKGVGKIGGLLGFEAGGQVPDWDAIAMKESGGVWDLDHGDADSTGGLQIQTRTWHDFGGDAYAPQAYLATKAEQIAIAEKILAKQGPGAWAGGKNFVWKTGTGINGVGAGGGNTQTYVRGTGPKGEQGYYKPADAAEQQATRDEIAQLEGQIREDKAKIAELKADATESDKIAAQNELAQHERELATQKTKLGEQQKGEFVAGEPPEQHYEPYSASEIQAAEDKAAAAAGKLREAEAQQRELKADATQSEREAAQNKIDQAKREKAAADADVAEKRKGKLVEGAAADTHKTEWDAKLNELAAIPGGIVNSLLADLGIGDIFPDLTQTPLWKSFAGGLTAFKGPIQGLVEGKLGIQQPGWQPGMPIPEPQGSGEPQTDGGGGFTIPGMFGLPNIEIPPPPPGPEEHPGSGAPPGPINTTIDASTNYINSPIGANPADAARADGIRSDNAIARVGPIAPDR